MFAWLVLGSAAVTLARGSRLTSGRALPARTRPRLAALAGLLAVATAGCVVAGAGKPDRLEHAFAPARTLADRVRAEAPSSGTVAISGSSTETAIDLQGTVAYTLRSSGVGFVVSSLPGIGTRYDPARHPHDAILKVLDPAPVRGTRDREIARVTLVDVPADAPPGARAPRPVAVTLGPSAPRHARRLR